MQCPSTFQWNLKLIEQKKSSDFYGTTKYPEKPKQSRKKKEKKNEDVGIILPA